MTLNKSCAFQVPTFVSKKLKAKKASGHAAKGHSFAEAVFASGTTRCHKCGLAFWGAGAQGLQCQRSKCELRLHRSCVGAAGVPPLLECVGAARKIGADYKERLDSFQKILFGSGSKRREEEERGCAAASATKNG